MKTKLILDITKSQQAQLNAVVTGRQGDKGTVTVNVFVVDGGVPYNLTGNTIYYEGLKPNNAYVRDTSGVKIINATQGNFEYTFRPETFGVAGIGKRSYFSIEQGGTIRASTQDFGLITLADAMTGNTMSGPYISELEELINLAQWLVDDINSRWTSINTQLTQLQNKLNTMDVVKRSGDTMTGVLNMGADIIFDTARQISTKTSTGQLVFGNSGLWINDTNGNFVPLQYRYSDKAIFINALTTLTKKLSMKDSIDFDMAAGGQVKFTQDPAVSSARGFMFYELTAPNTVSGGIGKYRRPTGETYYMGWGANPWSDNTSLAVGPNRLTYKNFAITTAEKDGTTTIPLSAEATGPDVNYPLSAVRRGNTVTLKGAVTLNSNATGVLVATLPLDLRPAGGNLSIYTPTTDGTAMVQVFVNGSTGAVAISPNGKGKRVDFVITYAV